MKTFVVAGTGEGGSSEQEHARTSEDDKMRGRSVAGCHTEEERETVDSREWALGGDGSSIAEREGEETGGSRERGDGSSIEGSDAEAEGSEAAGDSRGGGGEVQ